MNTSNSCKFISIAYEKLKISFSGRRILRFLSPILPHIRHLHWFRRAAYPITEEDSRTQKRSFKSPLRPFRKRGIHLQTASPHLTSTRQAEDSVALHTERTLAWRPCEHLRHVLLHDAKFKVSEAASSQSLRREAMSPDNPRHVLIPTSPKKEGRRKQSTKGKEWNVKSRRAKRRAKKSNATRTNSCSLSLCFSGWLYVLCAESC